MSPAGRGDRSPARRRLARTAAVAVLAGVIVVFGGFLLTSGAGSRFLTVDPTVTPSPTPTSTKTARPAAAAPSASATPQAKLGSVHVVAIGDSVTAGTACNCTAFPDLYAQQLADTYGVKTYVRNDGQGGETSQDVLDDLRNSDDEQNDIAEADIVVITIGANDFGPEYNDIVGGTCGGSDDLDCTDDAMDELDDNLTDIVQRIRTLRDGAPTAILMTGYWNVFTDGQVAADSVSDQGRAASDKLTLQTNTLIQKVAKVQHATYVDLYTPFEGQDGQQDPTDLLAEDGDHPNAAGHQLIATALLDAGTAPLSLG